MSPQQQALAEGTEAESLSCELRYGMNSRGDSKEAGPRSSLEMFMFQGHECKTSVTCDLLALANRKACAAPAV